MLNLPQFTDTEIAKVFEVPIERVQALRAELTKERSQPQ
jgi:hypothetical protein